MTVELQVLRSLFSRPKYLQFKDRILDDHWSSFELAQIAKAIGFALDKTPEIQIVTTKRIRLALEHFGQEPTKYDPILARLRRVRIEDSDFIHELVHKFVTNAAMKTLARKIIEDVETNQEVSPWEVKAELDTVIADPATVTQEDNYHFSEAMYLKGDSVVPLGLDRELDLLVSVGSGEILVVLANVGVGKTMICVCISKAQLMQGKSVLFVTADEPRRKIFRRHDQSILGVTGHMLRRDPVRAQFARDKIREWGSHLEVMDVTYERTTVPRIGARVQEMQAIGRGPSVIIVDYPDKLFSPGIVDKQQQVDTIYDDLARLSAALGPPVVVPSQVKYEWSAKKIDRVEAASWSKGKAEKCTSAISLNKVPNPLDSRPQLMVSVLKSREEGRYPDLLFNVDTDRQLLWR